LSSTATDIYNLYFCEHAFLMHVRNLTELYKKVCYKGHYKHACIQVTSLHRWNNQGIYRKF